MVGKEETKTTANAEAKAGVNAGAKAHSKATAEPLPEEPTGSEERKALFAAARRVMLAAVGAVALAQDEAEDFIQHLVERGEIAEKDGRNLVQEMLERRKKRVEKAEDIVTRRVEGVLSRMNVPSKADIETLSEKIAALSKKIDDIKKS